MVHVTKVSTAHMEKKPGKWKNLSQNQGWPTPSTKKRLASRWGGVSMIFGSVPIKPTNTHTIHDTGVFTY